MPIPFRPSRAIGLVFILAIAWVLYPFWLESKIPAFRDGFHFYYPQAVWLDASYDRGEYFPKWNPNEGLGSSVVGQPTWQIYYPLRVLWMLPVLNAAQRYALFVAIHLVLAAIGIYRVGRALGWWRVVRWLSAVAFALGCPVLFQLNNLIYLCSATWIAWGLLPVMRIVALTESRSAGWNKKLIILCEVCIAGCLMTLAGDPHNAVNYGLIVLLAIAYHGWLRYSSQRTSSHRSRKANAARTKAEKWSWNSLWLQVPLASSLLGITMCQVFASMPWYRLSNRAGAEVAKTDSFHPPIAQILEDQELVRRQRIFDFSISPWNLPTLLWPTWAGNFQPTNSRWVQSIPSEGRMWIPSFYIGTIPALLGFAFLARRSGRKACDRFVVFLFAFTMLLSMGNYSLVWIVRNAMDGVGASGLTGLLPTDASGSLYGLLKTIIPGYESFRYPAKWSVWMAASLAILAGCGFNRLVSGKSLMPKVIGAVQRFLAINFFILIAWIAALQYDPFSDWLRGWMGSSTDSMLGSPSPTESIHSLTRSLLQPIVVLIMAFALLHISTEPTGDGSPRWAWAVVALLVLDLASLTPQWISSTPSLSAENSQIAATAGHASSKLVGRSENLYWANTSRAELRLLAKSNTGTMDETLQLQREFLQGKLCHMVDAAALHASGSIEPQAIIVIKRWLQRRDNLQRDQPELDEVLGSLGVNQRLFLAPDGSLSWKTVKGSKAFCELVTADQSVAKSPSVGCKWLWTSSDQFSVQVEVGVAAKLIVRQMNDGGWAVASDSFPELQLVPNELFLVCPIEPGSHVLNFTRK